MTKNRQTKKQATREKILASAFALFNEKGYENTSYADIAKHAGLGYGTIYSHFESKDNLLVALSIFNLDIRLESLHDLAKTVTNPLERVFTLVDYLWKYDAQIPRPVVEAFYAQRWHLREDTYDHLVHKMNEFVCLVSDSLREAQTLGFVPKQVDVPLVVHILGSCYYRALQDSRFNDKARKKAKALLDKQSHYLMQLDTDE